METLRDLRQAYQDVGKGSSQSGSLPGLWTDRSRHLDRLATLDPSLASPGPLRTTGTACLLVPPKPRGRSESVAVHSLAAPQPSQLSQSAPSLMEPLMDPNSLLQARAHIQTRLVGCSETERSFQGRKGSLPSLHPTCSMPRTPKHLAPLEGRQGDRAALPRLRHPPPLKPISLTPLSSRARLRRDRLSWAGVRGPPATRGGSEESSSSSTSSHSSIDLEEDIDDGDLLKSPLGQSGQNIKNIMHLQSDKVHSQTRGPLVIQRGTTEHIYHREPVKCPSVERQTVQTSKSVNEIRPSHSSDLEAHNDVKDEPGVMVQELIKKTSQNTSRELTSDQPPVITSPALETHKGCREVQIMEDNCKVSTVDTQHPCLPATVNITLTEEKMKPVKHVKIKERRGSTSLQTNQSFNVLARKDHARGRAKSKSNLRTSSVPSLIKAKVRHTPDLVVCGEATENPVKSRSGSSMAGPKIMDTSSSLQRKRVIEPPRPCIKRSNLEKRTLNNKKVSTQKQAAPGEPKSVRQPKKPGTLGTPRAKSAVDYIPYSDMFKEIHSGDEGPAIYEMFAGPVYDNLRVSSSCERCRTVQSAPPKKTPTHRAKYKYPKKPLEASRRKKSPVEKLISCKGKQRAMLPRAEPPTTPASPEETGIEVAASGQDWLIQPNRNEINPSEDDDDVRNSPNTAELQVDDHTLSVIEEVLSSFSSKTLTPNCNRRGKTAPPPSGKSSHTNRNNSEEASDTDDEGLYVWEYMRGKLSESDNDDNRKSARHLDHPVPIPSASPVQPKINTWTSGSCDGTMSPVFQKFLDEAGKGPLTDELLRCLAEELISLDEGDASENYDSHRRELRDHPAHREEKLLVGDATSPEVALSGSGEVMDDAITWTKGEVLGRGAYGTVYCGLTSHGQLIAVKQVTLDVADPETADKEYKRLQEEVDLLKTLRHHNIVGYLGTLLRQHVVSIFMEYVPGGSIASILHRFGPLPERVLALYTQQILEGVSFLHLNRVIHRDLKGNNVMLMPTGVVKLIDFGCARRLSCLNHSASRSELLKSVHGTPYWMAPEVINESGHGRKSDIWSVGCTVFEMATGKPPLSHMDKMAALFYIGARRGLMPSLPDGFSKEARDFVQVCLTSDQKLRPTAEQLLEHAFIPKERGLSLR
ncbi:mitogen-activated protein kinase kinase kinase 19 [Osmerus eperlanus]|uniref:mitogen-activated protein kinase kinase kinase 19 n=1 Tax=Osmerus eperlanus TaxID=29151 RepID=UPI002E0FA5EA